MAKERCSKCGKLKEQSEFYKNRASKGGLQWDCKTCRRKYNKQNREQIKKRQQEYNQACKEQIATYVQGYRKEHKEKVKAVLHEWYINNKAKIVKTQQEYRQTPNGKLSIRRADHNRRARLKQTETTLTASQWAKVLEMQNNRCTLCGKKFTVKLPPTVDHIIPLSKNGDLTFENVQGLCRSCNSRKNCHLDMGLIQSWSAIGRQSFAFSSP